MFSSREIELTLGRCERFYRSIDYEDSTGAFKGTFIDSLDWDYSLWDSAGKAEHICYSVEPQHGKRPCESSWVSFYSKALAV